MIRAFALGCLVGALLHWLAGRTSSLALPPQRGKEWLTLPTPCRSSIWDVEHTYRNQTDPYLADLAAIWERERW